MPIFSDVRLETERLVLRPFAHTDAADLFAVYSDPQVFRYIPIGDWKLIDESHNRIACDMNSMAAGDYIRLAVERREDARVVGEVLLFKFDWTSKRAEVGYALAQSAWGSGYVAEALAPLVDYAFRELEMARLEAVIDPLNTASSRVVERLGFTHEGTLRENAVIHGKRADSAIWGLLRREWEARGRA